MDDAGRAAWARRRAIVAAFLLAASPAAATAPDRPATSDGDVRFSLDTASFATGGPETRQELYLQIPSTELKFVEKDEVLHARIELDITFRDTSGTLVAERKGVTELPVNSVGEATNPAEVHVLQSDFLVPPGPYRVEVKLRDLERRSSAVPVLLFIRKRASGTASFDLNVPAFPASGLCISDVQFAREIERVAEETPFRKGALSVVPCPDRVYGLLLPKVHFYYELFDAAGGEREGEVIDVSYDVLSSDGSLAIAEQEQLVLHGAGPWARSAALDVSGLPAGRYEVRATAAVAASGEQVASSGAVEVIWSALSWNKTIDELITEIAPVASSQQQSHLKRLSTGEREQFLAKFWKDLDPTPDTPRNEVFEAHYQRIRIADRRFGTRVRGMLTDRGRIFIRFGEPDEVSTGFATDEFVGGYLQKPKNEFNFEEEGRARGGYNYKDKTYEIWSYDQKGDQLGKRAEVGSGLGLEFGFVDLSGYGDFELVFSTEGSEY